MRGILSYGSYVPFRRLDRAAIREVMGAGGGSGTRSVASFDEDTTTMGVAAASVALRAAGDVSPEALWFATTDPAYLEKTNATAIHAALRLPRTTAAFDFGGAVRSGMGALQASLSGGSSTLVVMSDIRVGLPTSADEATGGDGAAAFVVGEGTPDTLAAELLGQASATDEFLDRWRTPGDRRNRQWEERFGETRYLPLAQQAWAGALAASQLAEVDKVVLAGVHERAKKKVAGVVGDATIVDQFTDTVGNTGTAHPGLVLAATLDDAQPGETIAVVMVADGVDVLVFRAADGIAARRADPTTAQQLASGGSIAYAKFLQWRGMIEVEPPNRPGPSRISASAAARHGEWKYGFVASAGDQSGLVHMPPARVSISDDDTLDAQREVPMADAVGTIVSFTVDRLVYSVSPPVVFAVVDFDTGGRLPMELTDVDPDSLAIGDRVEPTFRRLFTADGIHNYFWKARPVREPR